MNINDSLGYMVCRTARKVHQRLTMKFSAYDITLGQWVALKMLDEQKGISQKQLALLLEKDQNNVTAILNRLEKKALVQRTVNPTDKRAFSLFVTDKGRQLVAQLTSIDEKEIAFIEAPLTKEEAEMFKAQLLRIEKQMDAQKS